MKLKYTLTALFAFYANLLCASFHTYESTEDSIEIIQTRTYEGAGLWWADQVREADDTRQTIVGVLGMFQEVVTGLKIGNVKVYPHVWEGSEYPNASYSPQENALRFNVTVHDETLIHTCLSNDIVAHETGHLVSHKLRPDWCRQCDNQTGAFEESFGDITSILFDLRHGRLRSFIDKEACLGDDIGLCIREISHEQTTNDFYRCATEGTCEVHEYSQPFTGAVHSAIKKTFFQLQRAGYAEEDIALHLSRNFTRILCGGVLDVQKTQPSFDDIARSMLNVAGNYRTVLGESFASRGILTVSPTDHLHLSGLEARHRPMEHGARGRSHHDSGSCTIL